MQETSAIRVKTRRLKEKAIDAAMVILDDENHKLYNETLLTVLKNTVPRTQEITGEDGGDLKVVITDINYIIPNGNNLTTNSTSAPSIPSPIEPIS